MTRAIDPEARCERSGLSLIFCTRDRPADLTRAIHSVMAQARDIEGVVCQVLIVDDGALDSEIVSSLRHVVEQESWGFDYLNKSATPGLLRSRVVGIERARHELLLFLDDDVEVEGGYLTDLLATFARAVDVVGVSGIDTLYTGSRWWRRIYEYSMGIRSFRKGRLSVSGFAHGIERWNCAKTEFDTEFLVGFNMAFRRHALRGVEDLEWFKSYSFAEDLYLSQIARSRGRLVANPRLRVKHYRSIASRDTREDVAYTQLANHYRLLKTGGASATRRVAMLWTGIGFLATSCARWLIDLAKAGRMPHRGRIRGLARGLKFVASDLISSRGAANDESARPS